MALSVENATFSSVPLVVQDELRERVRRPIDRLPEAYRTVLLLRDIEQMDTEETAHVLGATPNAV